ncbi:hypothetical protein J5Y03_12635 [Bacillus sp. RG28]|uniref:LTXXQ motif family protein n=1 Tax=Gottfriedia endophytica TaxID=2820819 RepID=A0A940SJG9_9BACI|nr:hypothetical protein [Gottfriedia endophytica]MBP0726020.1 hypothetical protein [Gottfriedia endophytica]
MKIRSSLIVPVLAASILAPAAGSAAMNHSNKMNTTATHENSEHHHKGQREKDLMNVINQYATPDLKNQLTQDLTTHKNLESQLHKHGSFQKEEKQEKTNHKAVYEANKQEIMSIKQQIKDGKITKEEAHKKLDAIFGNHEGRDHDKDKDKFKGKENGERGIFKELKTAIQKKDKSAINAALEKFDQQLQKSNQELQKELTASK